MLGAIDNNYNHFIHLPTSLEEWHDEQGAFEMRAGVPLVCAAVEGTFIELRRFKVHEGWYCRKDYPVVNLQAVVDHKQRFISFDLGTGSWIDKKIWSAQCFG